MMNRIIVLMTSAMVLLIGTCHSEQGDITESARRTYTKSIVDFSLAMRRLWEEHISYTRNFIISSIADLGDGKHVAERLIKNQNDIGSLVGLYFGEAAGQKLADLLRNHMLLAEEVVKAAKAGNDTDLANASERWKGNATAIAIFLSSINPYWPQQICVDVLHKHLDFTKAQVTARLQKSWKADIQAYDNGHDQILILADLLSNGIVKQFPDKFRD